MATPGSAQRVVGDRFVLSGAGGGVSWCLTSAGAEYARNPYRSFVAQKTGKPGSSTEARPAAIIARNRRYIGAYHILNMAVDLCLLAHVLSASRILIWNAPVPHPDWPPALSTVRATTGRRSCGHSITVARQSKNSLFDILMAGFSPPPL